MGHVRRNVIARAADCRHREDWPGAVAGETIERGILVRCCCCIGGNVCGCIQGVKMALERPRSGTTSKTSRPAKPSIISGDVLFSPNTRVPKSTLCARPIEGIAPTGSTVTRSPA